MDKDPYGTPQKRWYMWALPTEKSLNTKSTFWQKLMFRKYYEAGLKCCNEMDELAKKGKAWSKEGFKVSQKMNYYKFMITALPATKNKKDLEMYKKYGWKHAYQETSKTFKEKGILK